MNSIMNSYETVPELYKDLAWTDPETKLIWLPNNINVPELGMVYASGANIEEWKWAAVKAKELDENKTKLLKADIEHIRYLVSNMLLNLH